MRLVEGETPLRSGPLFGLRASHVPETVVVAQEFSGEFVRAGKHESVGEPQLLVASPQQRRTFGHRCGERSDRDPHGRDGVARLAGSTGSGEGDKRLGECACRSKQPPASLVGSFNVVNRALVVCVGAVQQSDQDAGVENQRSHSSRRRSSSPCS